MLVKNVYQNAGTHSKPYGGAHFATTITKLNKNKEH